MRHVQTIEAYYDGRAFVPIVQATFRLNERAIITIFDDVRGKYSKRENDKTYLSYAGTLSDENYSEIMEILEDAGQIDVNEW